MSAFFFFFSSSRRHSFFFFQAEDGIRDFCLSRGLGDVYKRQVRRERVSGNRSIVLGSAIMMSAGSVLTPFSDPTTPVGMLVLGLSAVMTGTGSAVLFLCWIELESGLGGRLALVELASSLCIAFVVGFLLIVGPAIPVIVLIVVMPVLSAAALRRSAPATPQLPREPEQPLSRPTATPVSYTHLTLPTNREA